MDNNRTSLPLNYSTPPNTDMPLAAESSPTGSADGNYDGHSVRLAGGAVSSDSQASRTDPEADTNNIRQDGPDIELTTRSIASVEAASVEQNWQPGGIYAYPDGRGYTCFKVLAVDNEVGGGTHQIILEPI